MMADGTSKIAMVFSGWTCLMVIGSPLLLNLATKRYITELTFNQETELFSATILNFFNQKKKIQFKKEEVQIPAIPGIFTSFLVRNQPLLMDPSFVLDKQAYMHMMRCDKTLGEFIERQKKQL